MTEMFWEAVRQCLRKFHGFDSAKAKRKSSEMRKRLEGDQSAEPIYHYGPFFVASAAAGNFLDFEAHRADYNEIIEQLEKGFSAENSPH